MLDSSVGRSIVPLGIIRSTLVLRVWLTRQSRGLPVRNRVLSPAYVRVSTEHAQRYVTGSPSPVCVQAKRAEIPNHRAPIGPI